MFYSGGKITKKKWFYKTFPSLFCRSDLCLMLSARKSYFRSEMKPKTLVFALHFAHLFVTLHPQINKYNKITRLWQRKHF
jgi:hypothetical protein